MKAAIVSQGSVSSQWTFEAMKNYFDEVANVNLNSMDVRLCKTGIEVLNENKPMGEFDCIYAKGSFRYAQLLTAITKAYYSKCYMPIKEHAFVEGHNKLLTQLRLQESGIPMPKTYLTPSTEAAKELIRDLDFPIILKFPEGSHGKGVMFADNYASASSMLDALTTLNQPFIIQEYVETGGTDIRAFVIGDKVAAAMERRAAKEEKRANIHAGGTGEPVDLDLHTQRIAVKAAQALGCDICGVDILKSDQGPLIIEINLSPGLQGITKATKLDMADKIAKFLADSTAKQMKEHHKKASSSLLNECGVDRKIEMQTSEPSSTQQIITNLIVRGKKIVLPEMVTNLTDFDEKHEVVIKASKGKLIINKFN
jgi:ribosomal protein S6--L-glutamate ligase